MPKVYGLSKQQILQKHYADAKQEAMAYVTREKTRIDGLIQDFYKEKTFIEKAGLHVGNVYFSFFRGMLNGAIDIATTYAAIAASFANNISHVIDDENETFEDYARDVGFMFTDLGATFVEGFMSAGIGFAADISASFGADTKWAYGDGGAIASINKDMNRIRASVLDGSNPFDFIFDKNVMNIPQQESQVQKDKELLASRWNTQSSDDFLFKTYLNDKNEHFRRDIFQTLMKVVDSTSWAKEKVNEATLKYFFEKELGNSKGYMVANGVSESIGRLVPAMLLSNASRGNTGMAQAMGVASKAYFASSVYGSSFEEAIKGGASMQDAYTYAFGNMALELGSEQMFGFKLGEGIDASTWVKVVDNIMGEAVEEMVAEYGARGLSYYSNKDNYVNTQETTSELNERVAYSALMGGISGGIFSGGAIVGQNLKGAKGTLEQLEQGLIQSVRENGSEATKSFLNKNISKLQKQLNAKEGFFNKNDKKTILEHGIGKQIFEKQVTKDSQGNEVITYVLNGLGQKLKSGDIFAKQGTEVITKETHAIGGDNYLKDLPTEINTLNGKKSIRVVTQQELKNHKNGSIAQRFLDAGWNVAFVEVQGRNAMATPDGFNSFVNDGIVYVNLNSKEAMVNLVSHEVQDKLGFLARNGMLTQKQSQAYQKFLKDYMANTNKELFKTLGIKFDEEAYTKLYFGRSDFKELMQTERVSAFIQQAMNNSQIIENALNHNKNIFQKIASIFTNKNSYSQILSKMGLDPVKNKDIIKVMNKLQKSFEKAIKANEANLKAREDILSSLYTQTGVDSLFSLDGENRITNAKIYFDSDKFKQSDGRQVGMSLNSFFNKQNLEIFLKAYTEKYAHKYTYEIITQESNPELYERGYFLQWDGMYFNKKDFYVSEKDTITELSFDVLRNRFIFELTSFDYGLHEYHQLNPMMRVIYPHLKTKDGFIKNPVYFEASIRAGQLAAFDKLGFLPSQSFAMTSASGRVFETNPYGPVKLILKNSIVDKEDFGLFFSDTYTPIRTFNFRKNVLGFKNKTKEVAFDEKMKLFYYNIEHTRDFYAENHVKEEIDYIDSEDYDRKMLSYDSLLTRLRSLMVNTQNKKKTREDIKSELEQANDLSQEPVHTLFEKAVSSLEYLVRNDVPTDFRGNKLKTIFEGLNYLDQEKYGSIRVSKEVYGAVKGSKYREHFENILHFMKYMQYDFVELLSEGKAQINPEDIEVIYFTKNWSNKRSTLPKDIHEKVMDKLFAYTKQVAEKYGIEMIIEDDTAEKTHHKHQFNQKYIIQNENARNIAFSVDSSKGKVLEKNDILEIVKRIKATGYKLKTDKQGIPVNFLGAPLTMDELELLEYVQTTDNANFDIKRVVTSKAYSNILEKIEILEAEYMKKYNIPEPDGLLIETDERIQQRREIIAYELERVEKSNIAKDKRMMIVVGYPAAGKSSRLADILVENEKAYLADSDEIKKRFPEYNGFNGHFLHEESKLINQTIIKVLEKKGYNIVLPITGGTTDQVLKYANAAKEMGYSIELYNNSVEAMTSTRRGIARTIVDMRYIPLTILHGSAKTPDMVYEQLKGDELFDGYYKQSNEVRPDEAPIFIESDGLSGTVERIKGKIGSFSKHPTINLKKSGVSANVNQTTTVNDDGRVRQQPASAQNEDITKALPERWKTWYLTTPPNEQTYKGIENDIKILDIPGAYKSNAIPQGVIFTGNSKLDLRAYVVVEYAGQKLPFYLSSGEGGKAKNGVTPKRWYPFLGLSEYWINKSTSSIIRNFYLEPALRAISEYLDDYLGDVTPIGLLHIAGVEGAYDGSRDGMTQQEMDFINEGLKPVQRHTDSTKENEDIYRERLVKIREAYEKVYPIKKLEPKQEQKAKKEKKEKVVKQEPKQAIVEETSAQVELPKNDYLDVEEKVEIESQITPITNDDFAQGVNTQTQQQNASKPKINRFKQATTQAKVSSKDKYESFEDVFEKSFDKINNRIKNQKTSFDKTIAALYKSWEFYIKKLRTKRQFYNHMGSQAAKVIVYELNTLANLIETDDSRTNKKPTDVELEYIVRKVNEAIFNTLDYVDSEVRIDINITKDNPNGYAFTRAIYWYFRDMLKVQNWDKVETSKFNKDHRGFAYRRLINAILNFNEKHGKQELAYALNHFARATNVEVVTDLALDSNAPRTIATTKKQWEKDVKNQILIKNAIDYKTRAGSWLDMFTIGETVGLHNSKSWSMVLNEKLVRGLERQMTIDREFEDNFEKDKWLKKNYKKIVDLERKKNAISIKSLGGAQVRLSQIMYLRNMVLREIMRNRAIDLGIIKGEKTNHFNDGNQINILEITDDKAKKVDNKQIVTLTTAIDLFNELDDIISRDSFMVEYNQKIIQFFNNMYPYVNERFKEIHGANLSNDGLSIEKGLTKVDKKVEDKLFDGMPQSVNRQTINDIYIPFLLDNSSYFDREKLDFKNIIDLGIFDGMTQELSDSNGKISVESITTVISSYSREVGNYYGLHRIMNDLNIMWNERLEGHTQTTYIGEFIRKDVIKFYTDLLNDMAGYTSPAKNHALNKGLSWFRRNFYRASLGLNFKVIGSQLTTLFNLSILYGNQFSDYMFPKMMKNFFAQHTKENKALLKELDKKNNVFHDRKRITTFEMGEATSEGIAGSNGFNRFTQALMLGISATDNAINNALYLTLLETKNPDTGKLFTPDEASEVITQAILRSQSSPQAISKSSLIRTDNEIFKVLLKFMGEPMKLITQAYNSFKHIQYIKHLEKNKQKIVIELDNAIDVEQKKYDAIENDLSTQESIENSNAFNNMSEQEQKAIHKEVKKLKQALEEQQDKLDDAIDNKKDVVNQVNEAIASKPKVQKLARRRYASIVVAITYLAVLRMGFELLRGKGGDKDKPEDESFQEYLLKMMRESFFDSVAGMFPFIRDIYQIISTGYDVDDIDEFSSFNDLGRSINYLIQAFADGKDINAGKTIHDMSIAMGKLFGLPMLQIERLITTPLLYLDESLHFKYYKAVGKKTRENVELKQAIEQGDTKMISAIIESKIREREIKVSNVVVQELERLATAGYEVKMSGINDTYTIDGVEYQLDKQQRVKFAEIYNKADLIIQKIIKTSYYKRLNDDMKESLIKAIYAYYYNMAKQEVFDVELIPEKNYFVNLNQAYLYFVDRSEAFYKKQRSPEYIQEQREKKRA